MWVRFTGPAPVESLESVIPHRLAAQVFICSYLSEVRYWYTDISMWWRGKTWGVVGVRDRAGAVKRPPHPVQLLLGSPPHRGTVVGPAVRLICQDRAISFAVVCILSPKRGIPGPAHLQSTFTAFSHLFQL